MCKKEIFLVWQTDEWLSHSSKVLAYLGECYEDCCEKIREECDLNESDFNELMENAQVRRENDGFFVESVPINGFHPDF